MTPQYVVLTSETWGGDPLAETVHALGPSARSRVGASDRSVPAGDTACDIPAAGMSVLKEYTQARLYHVCRDCFGERAPWEAA